jgi:hypothetical protein
VVGQPQQDDGFIDAALSKRDQRGQEQMKIDAENGKSAKTRYRTIDTAGRAARWLELEPLTDERISCGSTVRQLALLFWVTTNTVVQMRRCQAKPLQTASYTCMHELSRFVGQTVNTSRSRPRCLITCAKHGAR